MKNIAIYLILLVCLAFSYGCKDSTGKDGQKSTDLMTIKTLGLAYLEEFKLEEAEQQFLQFIKLAPKEKLGYANLGLVYLRMAKYDEAEKQLKKALKIDPKDPDIRHILAIVYKMEDNNPKAIAELKEALKLAPDHTKVLYDLTEIYAANQDAASQKSREDYMLILTHKAPGNIVPLLNLTDMYLRKGLLDSALARLETIKRQFPDFPREAVPYYNNTIDLIHKKDKDNAVMQFTIFHNYLKVSSPYQAGIMDLKGPGGSLIGFPLITFDQQSALNTMEGGSVMDVIKFTDVTATAGLDIIPMGGNNQQGSSHIESGDFDSDGDIDLYAGSYDPPSKTYRHFLLSNDMGRFTDISSEAGVKHTGIERSSVFADFDNDGFMDLFVITDEGFVLYRNAGKQAFENVTRKSKINALTNARKALFFDPDHDGDLDIFEITDGFNALFRNNADGTFSEQASAMGIAGTYKKGNDATFGDFDEDGDIDFIVASEDGTQLFSNQRQGKFKEVASVSNLKQEKEVKVVTTGDFNNDGFLDLFVSAKSGSLLYENMQNGSFKISDKSGVTALLQHIQVNDALFLDFDNDGFLDLAIAGEAVNPNERGLVLLRNDGKGVFSQVNHILPETPKAGRELAVFDYNDDGDMDLAIAGINGGISLLRNDGGNNNHFIKMKLVGLTAGSAKNNHFGIGAKVEVRSGELYQTMVVTDPDVHFGLGNKKQADVIRITWTNGVPQNIFMPNSDQSLVESQTLKGSCPFLYTWDGEKYVFAKDILWRSALGMPLGIMGGNTAYAFADASDDYLKIPGEILQPKDNKYTIQVTSELWEIIYIDQIDLVAVDHPANADIFVPEQFTPPPFPGMKIVQTSEKHLPISAFNHKGNNVLPFISAKDDQYISEFQPDKYQGIVEMHDLILDPGRLNADHLLLFLTGWIFPTDASINIALSQTTAIKVQSPVIQVVNSQGEWQTVISDLSFPMGKDKTVIADLSGRFLTKDHRIRIRTNMEIYWDYVFFSDDAVEMKPVCTPMEKISADLHYRGFSAGFRKGGRYGPHWFDYYNITTGNKWRDLTGNYTRFGNVLPLLAEPDNQYIISNAGDEVTIEFSTDGLPPLPNGWKRDFLIRSVGWVKDGDINTAFGNTVLPLPFHGMKSYPPSPDDIYPDTKELQNYNKEYNTRIVNSDGYLHAIKEMGINK